MDTGWVTTAHPDGTLYSRRIVNGTSADITTLQSDLTTAAAAGNVTTPIQVSPSQYKDRFNLFASYRPQNFSARATSWGAQSDQTVDYPAFTDVYGTVWRAFKVHYYYNTTDGSAFSDLKTTATAGYTNVPSYRGIASGARRVGVGRWTTVRVEVSNT